MANITRVGEGKVVLISGGGKIYTDIAARFCKSQRSLDEILASDYDKRIVQNILAAGHLAATEFDYFLFGVEGYSRVTEAQLVRKRIASYLISSGRTETHGKRKFDIVLPEENLAWKEVRGEVLMHQENAPMNLVVSLNYLQILEILESWYNNAVAAGIPEEEARYMKPQATMFKAIIGMGAHALLDWFKIRCCCYDDQTEVLTLNGWKYFKDINVSDRFYSLNPKTLDCEFVESKKIIKEKYSGSMISVRSQSIDLLVTPNHQLFVSYKMKDKRYKNSDKLKFSLDYASEHKNHNTILMKKNCNPIQGIVTETFTIPSLVVKDKNQYTEWDKEISSKNVDIKDFMRFMGMYISDGCVIKSGYHYNIIISKGDFAKIQKYYVIMSRLTDNKVSIVFDKQKKSCYNLIVHDRRLYNYLINIGKAYDKHIPEDFFKYDYSILGYLMEGLLDGDGTYNKNNDSYSFSTTSVQLRDDFQRLALHIGFSSSYGIYHKAGDIGGCINDRQIISKHDLYGLSLNRKKNHPIIKVNGKRDAFSETVYNGYVYCVELEKNHILYVRRNGKCVWSGNSNAQTEIRDLANKMLKLCKQAAPDLFAKAGASCVSLGYCPEKWQCEKFKGKIPTHQDVLEMIHHWK